MDTNGPLVAALVARKRFDSSRTIGETMACCAAVSRSWAAEALRRPHPALVIMAAVFAVLAVAAPAQAVASARFVGSSLIGLAPLLVLAITLAAAAKATGADRWIAKAFAGHGATAIVAASLIGALSPFCSCGVIPLIAGLLGAGVPLPPVMAFWLASPLMDPETFIITAAQLGLGFAVAKTVTAIAMGLFGGAVTLAMMRAGGLTEVLRRGAGTGCGCGCGTRSNLLQPPRPLWAFWRKLDRLALFARETASGLAFLAPWMAVAFLGESLMLAWVPADLITAWLGPDGAFAIPIAVAIGVPAYLNGFAAVPLVSGLIDLGMSPGVALAFLTAGGVTSVPAMVAVFSLVRPAVFAVYLGCAAFGAAIAGYAYIAVLAVM